MKALVGALLSTSTNPHARVTAGAVWADAGHSDGPRLERGGDLGQDGGRRPARPQLAHQQHVTSLSRGAASGEIRRSGTVMSLSSYPASR